MFKGINEHRAKLYPRLARLPVLNLLLCVCAWVSMASTPLPPSTPSDVDANPDRVYFPQALNYQMNPAWDIQRVDAPEYFTEMSNRSLVMKYDSPCIAFGGDHLYLTCNFFHWTYVIIDSSFGVGRFAAITKDAQQNLYISYYDETNGALKVARQNGDNWTIDTVDTGEPAAAQGEVISPDPTDLIQPEAISSAKRGVGGYTSITAEGNGRMHVSYYDFQHQSLKYAFYDGTHWQNETVDQSGNVGTYTSIAVNSQGQPRIGYYDASAGNLKFATWNGSVWDTFPVDSSGGGAGQYVSLALDAQGYARMAYFGGNTLSLKYAYQAQDGFHFEVAASYPNKSGIIGEFASLVLDGSGNPMIAYFDDKNWALGYVSRNSSGWTRPAVIDSGDLVGRMASIAVTSSGAPCISYFHSSNGELKYAYYQDGGWKKVVLKKNYNMGVMPSIDLDSAGKAHIAYQDAIAHHLRYASWTGSQWSIEIADQNTDSGITPSLQINADDVPEIAFWQLYGLGYTQKRSGEWASILVDSTASNIGFNPSLVFDRYNLPHVSYYDAVHKDLKYAYKVDDEWFVDTLDEVGEVGDFSSMVLVQGKYPIISYYDATHGWLKVMVYDDNGWHSEVVDSSERCGKATSIALDNAGNPHISYFNDSFTLLKHAYKENGAWVVEVVDSLPAGGIQSATKTSLKIDALNWLHISYYDAANRQLKYAVRPVTGWQVFIVDSAGDVGRDSSMVLDAQGRPVIAYYDATNGDLKVARLR